MQTETREAWASELACALATEFEARAKDDLDATATDADYHASHVWGSIAAAIAFAYALRNGSADEGIVRHVTESAMRYVEITADLGQAMDYEYGLTT